ncbi:MAG: dephospho-CoA kinase [bacterium]
MLLFGITGGIGCGKTLVTKLLIARGVPIIEADPLAQELTIRLPEIRQALTSEFGADVYTPEGRLNKEKLSQLIFSDSTTRERINQIIHPPVLRWIQNEANRLHTEESHRLIGVEAALIYEAGMDRMLNRIVVVNAPLEKRIQWLQKRNNLSREEVLKRIESQIPLDEKVEKADYVIENDGTLKDLSQKVEALSIWLNLCLNP